MKKTAFRIGIAVMLYMILAIYILGGAFGCRKRSEPTHAWVKLWSENGEKWTECSLDGKKWVKAEADGNCIIEGHRILVVK